MSDQYELGQQFAEGGMGLLYLGRHLEQNTQVVFKFINPEFMEDAESRTRFEREGQITRKLQHSNIVKVYDVGEDEGLLYIIYEYVQGENLKDRIERLGYYGLDQGIEIMRQMCDGISFAHARGIMHRDIKPENIIISDAESQVKILDFGIAKPVGSGYTLTQAGYIIGTPEYLSPEQAAGNPATPASDQYALGVLAFEILTGRLPIEEENTLDYFSKKIRGDLTPISAFLPEFPRNLELAIEKALAVNPKDRYEAVGGFAQALEAFQQGNLDDSGRVKNAAPPVRVSTAQAPVTAGELAGGKPFSPARSSLRIVAPPTREIVIPTKPILALVLLGALAGAGMWLKGAYEGFMARWTLVDDVQMIVDVDGVNVVWNPDREVEQVEWIGADGTQVLQVVRTANKPLATIPSRLAADSVKLAFTFGAADAHPGEAELLIPGIERSLTGVTLKVDEEVSSPRVRWRPEGGTFKTPKKLDDEGDRAVRTLDLDPSQAFEIEVLGRTWTGTGPVMPMIRVEPGLEAIQGPLSQLAGLELRSFLTTGGGSPSSALASKNRQVQKVLEELDPLRDAFRQISSSASIPLEIPSRLHLLLSEVDLFRQVAAAHGVSGVDASIRDRFGLPGFSAATFLPLSGESGSAPDLMGLGSIPTEVVIPFVSSPDPLGAKTIEIVFRLMTDHGHFAVWVAVNGVDQTVFWGPVDWPAAQAGRGALSAQIQVSIPARVFRPGPNRIELKPRGLALIQGQDPGIDQGAPLKTLQDSIHITVDGSGNVPVEPAS